MLTQEILKSFASYDPETGILTRLKKTSHNSKKVGTEIGRLQRHRNRHTPYKLFSYKFKVYSVHRAIWLYVHGDWPDGEIDHIDGNGLNNRIDNLRLVTQTENMRNCRKKKINKSGCTGVYWNNQVNKWHAQIGNNSGHVHLGFCEDLFSAVCLRKSAEALYGYHMNHGRS